MKRIWLLAICLFGLNACADTGEPENPAARAQVAIDAAAAAYTQSQEAGHAWQATRVSLEAAQTALERGEFALAETEAQRALQIAKGCKTGVLTPTCWNDPPCRALLNYDDRHSSDRRR